ncbi:MAG: hypothetical protein B7C24_02355 [Bacteroidetes bacterium 4572_77]|nr:MAG: hypothetical protein B7C24_02355 [Bacteroidetes bacterium 4572_77]
MIQIFGYGSLVNKSTWNFQTQMKQVELKGWTREWRQIVKLQGKEICALSIAPQPTSSIQGILLMSNKSIHDTLNNREIGYQTLSLNPETIFPPSCSNPIKISKETSDIITFAASESSKEWARKDAPILLSYIDVVVKGYFDLFGRKGVFDFFKSTKGWDLPILNDRKDPLYPRSIHLPKDFLNFIDEQIIVHTKKK